MRLYFTFFLLFVAGLNVSNACNVTISASSTAICIGKSDTLTASGGSTYTWFPGGSTGNTLYVSPTVTTTYTVNAVDTSGCTSSSTITITVNPLPNVTSSAQNPSVCEGNGTVLTGFGASTYKWQPGNYTGSVFNVTPSATTTYTVTGTNSNGCTKTSTVSVTVKPAPKPILIDSFADATFGTPFNNCLNASTSPVYSVTVNTPSVAGITSYDIDWGNGAAVQTGLPFSSFPLTHTYNAYGVFNLVFTAHYANGCVRDTLIKVINQTNPAIGISNISGNTSGCAPIGFWFKMSNYQSNVVGTYYEWNFGDGTPIVTWNTVTTDSIYHIFSTTSCGLPNNQFVVSVKAINSCDETNATVSSIKISKKPVANFTVSPNPVCKGSLVTFVNSSTPASNIGNPSCNSNTNWSWNFGNGNTLPNTPILSNVTNTYNTVGTFTARLVAAGQCGNDTMKKTVCVEDNIVNYTMALPSLCAPTVMNLNNISINTDCIAQPYTWSITKLSNTCTADSSSDFIFINGTTINSLLPNIRFNNQGTYRVRLQHTNTCGTTTKDTIITIKRKPIVAIAPITPFCESAMLTPIATTTNCGVNAITYLWNSVGATPSSSVSATPSFSYTNGNYTLSLTATNECGSSTTSTPVTVKAIPVIGLIASPSPICLGGSSTLTATGGSTYSWLPNSSTGSTKFVTPTVTTIYTVTATNAVACTNTKSITLVVNPNPSLVVSNTIPTCVPGNDANISITASNGTPSYTYQLNGGL
jgi:PKD repeat protein